MFKKLRIKLSRFEKVLLLLFVISLLIIIGTDLFTGFEDDFFPGTIFGILITLVGGLLTLSSPAIIVYSIFKKKPLFYWIAPLVDLLLFGVFMGLLFFFDYYIPYVISFSIRVLLFIFVTAVLISSWKK